MRKPKTLWNRLKRPYRIWFLILAISLVLLMLYTFSGSPSLTIEPQFRRAEKAHLVGPSEILGYTELETDLRGGHWNMLIAEDSEGVTFYCYGYSDPSKIRGAELIYRKKTGDLTVLSAPYPQDDRTESTIAALPIFLFDEYPEALRAELDITLSTTYKGESFEKTYQLSSVREQPGYFQFSLSAVNLWGLGIEGYAIQVLTLISGYGGRTMPEISFPATVRLYNGNDELICETTLEITSPVRQAHDDRQQ